MEGILERSVVVLTVNEDLLSYSPIIYPYSLIKFLNLWSIGLNSLIVTESAFGLWETSWMKLSSEPGNSLFCNECSDLYYEEDFSSKCDLVEV